MRAITYYHKVIMYILIFLTTGCTYAQKKDEPTPKPKVEYHVNKEVDEHGNIIRYDSTYSWSWSNIDSENSNVNFDSIFSDFFKDWRSPFDYDSSFFGFSPFKFPSFDDIWFDFDKQMQSIMQRHQQMLKQHEEIMKQFFQPKPLIPAPDDNSYQAPKNENKSKQENKKTSNKQGIDM